MINSVQTMYALILLTIIALTLLVLLFFSIYRLFFNNNSVNSNKGSSGTYQQIMEDLDRLIQRKCAVSYRRALQPYVSKRLKNTPLINDEVVNNISITITKDVLNEMSEEYRTKLECIYKAEILDDIILENVYNTVTEMAMSINKNSIKKSVLNKSIETIAKNDIDS